MIPIDPLGAAERALEAIAGGAAPDGALSGIADAALKSALAAALAASEAAAAPASGTELDEFRVGSTLSRPGRPATVRATAGDGREVVLKPLAGAGSAARARALLAVLRAGRATSPALAAPLGVAAAGGAAWIVRAYVPGVTVAELMAKLKHEDVPPDAPTWRLAAGARGGGANVTGAKMVCRIGQYAAEALVALHAAKAVHGALKPENLVVDDTVKPTVLDAAAGHGAAPYEAPEVLRAADRAAARTNAADLYALGAVLHECLTRQPLFAGDAAAIEQATLRDKPIRPTKLNFKASTEMETIVLALLEKEPGARYGSAQELFADLDRYHKNEPIQRKAGGLLKRLFG